MQAWQLVEEESVMPSNTVRQFTDLHFTARARARQLEEEDTQFARQLAEQEDARLARQLAEQDHRSEQSAAAADPYPQQVL